QRVAIARALVTTPQVLFADEPTGALDTRTSRDVLWLLSVMVTEQQQTIIMVTHDPMAAAYADRVIFLADGRVTDTLARPTAEAVAAHMARLEVSADDPASLAC
ncbi:MAG TPA: ABC transporter ATP-binding protein, partial [Trebonia sp.]|nr:ABC transporter ATP-binding protein [Trebonia sp.]